MYSPTHRVRGHSPRLDRSRFRADRSVLPSRRFHCRRLPRSRQRKRERRVPAAQSRPPWRTHVSSSTAPDHRSRRTSPLSHALRSGRSLHAPAEVEVEAAGQREPAETREPDDGVDERIGRRRNAEERREHGLATPARCRIRGANRANRLAGLSGSGKAAPLLCPAVVAFKRAIAIVTAAAEGVRRAADRIEGALETDALIPRDRGADAVRTVVRGACGPFAASACAPIAIAACQARPRGIVRADVAGALAVEEGRCAARGTSRLERDRCARGREQERLGSACERANPIAGSGRTVERGGAKRADRGGRVNFAALARARSGVAGAGGRARIRIVRRHTSRTGTIRRPAVERRREGDAKSCGALRDSHRTGSGACELVHHADADARARDRHRRARKVATGTGSAGGSAIRIRKACEPRLVSAPPALSPRVRERRRAAGAALAARLRAGAECQPDAPAGKGELVRGTRPAEIEDGRSRFRGECRAIGTDDGCGCNARHGDRREGEREDTLVHLSPTGLRHKLLPGGLRHACAACGPKERGACRSTTDGYRPPCVSISHREAKVQKRRAVAQGARALWHSRSQAVKEKTRYIYESYHDETRFVWYMIGHTFEESVSIDR